MLLWLHSCLVARSFCNESMPFLSVFLPKKLLLQSLREMVSVCIYSILFPFVFFFFPFFFPNQELLSVSRQLHAQIFSQAHFISKCSLSFLSACEALTLVLVRVLIFPSSCWLSTGTALTRDCYLRVFLPLEPNWWFLPIDLSWLKRGCWIFIGRYHHVLWLFTKAPNSWLCKDKKNLPSRC